jgi:PIN domain nuclease of toxin-antitoxin system
MNLLLDTCALVWLGMGGGDLGAAARRRIEAAPALYYSSISAWELARLAKEGKIVLGVPPGAFLSDLADQYGLASLPPTDETMLRAAQLPDIHKDPADRIIIATAQLHNLPVVTGDARFPQYGVRTIC